MEVQRLKGFTKDLRFQMRRMLCFLTDPTKTGMLPAPSAPRPLPQLASTPSLSDSHLLQVITAEAQKPFQLQQGPLVRFTLIRVAVRCVPQNPWCLVFQIVALRDVWRNIPSSLWSITKAFAVHRAPAPASGFDYG